MSKREMRQKDPERIDLGNESILLGLFRSVSAMDQLRVNVMLSSGKFGKAKKRVAKKVDRHQKSA